MMIIIKKYEDNAYIVSFKDKDNNNKLYVHHRKVNNNLYFRYKDSPCKCTTKKSEDSSLIILNE